MKSELNPRQWALYNLLKNNPDKCFKQIEIAKLLPEHYSADTTDLATFHFSYARRAMTDDIRKINDSDIIQKIIIANKDGIKLASKAEFEKYINGEFAAIFRRLKRTRNKARKAGLDGQMRFTVGKERDTAQAFTDSINRLKSARLAKGLKLADVVKELAKTEKGIDVPLLSKMESGYCKPTERVLFKLAEIYAVEPLELLDDKLTDFDIIA